MSLLMALGNLVDIVSEAIAEDQIDDFIEDLKGTLKNPNRA